MAVLSKMCGLGRPHVPRSSLTVHYLAEADAPSQGGSNEAQTRHRIVDGCGFCAALGLAVVVLAILGTDARGIGGALRVTARFPFLLFWLAYSGGAMAALFGSIFQPLARRGRELGLAFASAHLIHVDLVIWLTGYLPSRPSRRRRLSSSGSLSYGPTCWRCSPSSAWPRRSVPGAGGSFGPSDLSTSRSPS